MTAEIFNYQVIIKGTLNPDWQDWLETVEISHHCTNQGLAVTTLIVEIPDQSALHGMLMRLHMLSLELLLVKRLGIGNISELEND